MDRRTWKSKYLFRLKCRTVELEVQPLVFWQKESKFAMANKLHAPLILVPYTIPEVAVSLALNNTLLRKMEQVELVISLIFGN